MYIAYQIEEATYFEENQWYVIGRVLRDIRVGEVLYSVLERGTSFTESEIIDPNVFPEMEAFTIVKLVMIGHSMESISRGYAAGIYLQGEPQAQLAGASVLVTKD